MLRPSLTDSQRSELQALRRADLSAASRDRSEVVPTSAAGRSPPKIAERPGRRPHTARAALKGFAARGAEALGPGAPGPDPDHDRRAAVTGTLSELLGQERTRTARQSAGALGPGIGTGRRRARRYSALAKAGSRRTAQAVGHRPDPSQVERARRTFDSLGKS